ncbi:MAG: YceI family protein [Gammaproteobacteria bacterium]
MQSLFATTALAADSYTLDPQHSYILWHVKHFGYSTQVGKFYASGTLVLDKKQPQNSKVNATITVANVSTGIEELDKHLKGKLFFDADQFPTATFTSSAVNITGKSTAKVEGMLTLHGFTKPVTLSVTFNQQSVNPISDKMTVGFSATTIIKRSDFGISTLLPGLGDDVKLDIEAEAYKT